MTIISIIIALSASAVSAISAYLVAENPLVWQISLAIAVSAFATYFYQERKFYSELLSKKTTQYGLNALLMSLIAFGILIFVNLLEENQLVD